LGRGRSLRAVLAGLARQNRPLDDVEVVVALDGEAPSGTDFHDGADLPMKVVRARRAGASAARNAGWRAAGGELILFLDDDIVPTPPLVAEHLAWHGQHPEADVAVLGLVRWSPAVTVTPFMKWLETGIQFDYDRIEGAELGWQLFYSCNVSVKREILERVEGFDEQRFPYGYEDLELARRLSEGGFRLLYNDAALGHHLKVETLDGWRRNLRRIARSERRFVGLYPAERAYFYERFRAAADRPRARGRSAQLARWVGPRFPGLGPVVWRSYDVVCSQRLAPQFLSEWEAATAEPVD
jgi:GT2 family glycosyltransferase